MATTTFVDGQTVISADWLNDVDEAVYNPASITVPATSVSTTAISGISATDVQGVLAEIVAEKQPLDSTLTALATATEAADKIPYFTGTTTASTLTWNSASALANGATTISSNTVIKAAIDAMDIETQVAPSTSGNVLTSNGTIWTSTAKITSGSAVASTSGIAHDFTSIPSWVKRITIMLSTVSTDGTSGLLFQLGDSGGIENTTYEGGSQLVQEATGYSGLYSTAGIPVGNGSAGNSVSGTVTFTHLGSNIWVASGVFRLSSTQTAYCAGTKTLSATLTQIRVTTVNNATGGGTEAFDAGNINILYE